MGKAVGIFLHKGKSAQVTAHFSTGGKISGPGEGDETVESACFNDINPTSAQGLSEAG